MAEQAAEKRADLDRYEPVVPGGAEADFSMESKPAARSLVSEMTVRARIRPELLPAAVMICAPGVVPCRASMSLAMMPMLLRMGRRSAAAMVMLPPIWPGVLVTGVIAGPGVPHGAGLDTAGGVRAKDRGDIGPEHQQV